MKKNNKGFTMIEIIGVVIIIGVLLLLIIPGVSKLMAQFRVDYYEKMELTVNESGKDFFNDNKIFLPNGLLESTTIKTSSLIAEKYIDSLVDYKGDSCKAEDSYTIVIYRGDGKYDYQTCIDCSGENYITDTSDTDKKYCDPAWLDNVLHYDYGGTDDIYFYYGTPREEIREELIKTLNIVKKDSNGNVLDRVVIGDTNEEGILPTNIDIIDNKPVLDSNNKKEYEMIYENARECESGTCPDITLNAVIYKHKAPKVTMTSNGNTYNSGDWTNKSVVIKLEKNDSFFAFDSVDVNKYQWKKYGENNWQDITCNMAGDDGSCSIFLEDNYLEAKYQFRLVNTEGNISDETGYYTIKIDQIVPNVNLSAFPNRTIVKITTDPYTREDIYTTTQNAAITATVSDNHSGIDYNRTEVCYGSSCTNFYSSSYSKSYSNTSSKVITITAYDNAGNSNSASTTIYYSEEDNRTYYCTVYYEPNGGSVSPTSKEVECGDNVTLPTPTNTGNDFLGWYTPYEDLAGYGGNDYTVNEDGITLTAYWEEIVEEETTYYTVHYDPSGGTVEPESEESIKGSFVILPKPERTGYTFVGWYTGGEYVGGYYDMYYVYEETWLYAKWSGGDDEEEEEEETCRVNYDGNGGDVEHSSGYEIGTCGTTVSLPNATRDGYTFVGWCNYTDGTSCVGGAGDDFELYARSGNELFAKWELSTQNTYTINYVSNGDSCKSGYTCRASTTCTVGEYCTLATNNYQTANYHNTYGWNTESDGTGTSYENGETVYDLASAGGSVTLYSYYECDYEARTKNYQESRTFNANQYPWNLATWSGTTLLSYKSTYGCTKYRSDNGGDVSTAQTCFDDTHISNGVWEAYGVTCQYCGKNTDKEWCPVHNSNGGADKPICDQKSSAYTGANCRR